MADENEFDPEVLTFELEDGIATLTMNRPEVMNALNRDLQLALQTAFKRCHFDPEIRVAILTGAGDRAFCSGADRGRMGSDNSAATPERPAATTRRITPGAPGAESFMHDYCAPKTLGCWTPIVAAVNGLACGGAFYMLGESDIIIAAENATFFDPHVTFGMTSSYESIHMAQRMPLGEVLRMQLLGSYERMSAQRAHQIGLVSEVVPLDELLEAAKRVARIIAMQPPGAIQGTMRAIWATRDMPRVSALNLSPHYLAMANLDEWLEGQKTFQTGERAKWTLR